MPVGAVNTGGVPSDYTQGVRGGNATRQSSTIEKQTNSVAHEVLTDKEIVKILKECSGSRLVPLMFRGSTGYTKSVAKVAQAYMDAVAKNDPTKIRQTKEALLVSLEKYRSTKENQTDKKGNKKAISKSDQARLDKLSRVETQLKVDKQMSEVQLKMETLKNLLNASSRDEAGILELSKGIIKDLSSPRNDKEIIKFANFLSPQLSPDVHAAHPDRQKDLAAKRLLHREVVLSKINLLKTSTSDAGSLSNTDFRNFITIADTPADFVDLIKDPQVFNFINEGLKARESRGDFFAICLIGIYQKLPDELDEQTLDELDEQTLDELDEQTLSVLSTIAKACDIVIKEPVTKAELAENIKSGPFFKTSEGSEYLGLASLYADDKEDFKSNLAPNDIKNTYVNFDTDPEALKKFWGAAGVQMSTNFDDGFIDKGKREYIKS